MYNQKKRNFNDLIKVDSLIFLSTCFYQSFPLFGLIHVGVMLQLKYELCSMHVQAAHSTCRNPKKNVILLQKIFVKCVLIFCNVGVKHVTPKNKHVYFPGHKSSKILECILNLIR